MSKQQLSKAQNTLLRRIEFGPRYVAPYYPSAQKLVAYGYARWKERSNLEITEEGLAFLKAQSV